MITTPTLSPQLVDWLTEVVAHAPDPQSRSDAILALVSTIRETVEWRSGWEDGDELIGVTRILRAAEAHHARMNPGPPG